MELNWSTFVLEILNFLILVWILKHFLYKPVLNVISLRQAGIDQSLAEAAELREQSRQMQAQYENRLAIWDDEKSAARYKLRQELEQERSRLLKELEGELAAEREKATVREQRRLHETIRENERHALEQGSQFAARLLQRLADAHLEERLIELLLDDLATLDKARIQAIRASISHDTPAEVCSAFAMESGQQERITKVLVQLLGYPPAVDFHTDPELGAGVRITIQPWLVHANLADELKSFADIAHEPA